jgi:hypothetical protein
LKKLFTGTKTINLGGKNESAIIVMKKFGKIKPKLLKDTLADCVTYLEIILISFIVSIFFSSQISIYLSFAGAPINAFFRILLFSCVFVSIVTFLRIKIIKLQQKFDVSNIYGLVIFVVIFIWYGTTHSEWLRIDRDPGFISLGGKIFQDKPLFGLELSEFTKYPDNLNISSPGIYFVGGTSFSPLQGFPGTHEIYALLGLLTTPTTYPLFVGPLLSALIFFLTFVIIKKLTKSLIMPILVVTIGSTAIPMLYTGRTSFSEPIILLLNLLLIYFHVHLKPYLSKNTFWICSFSLAFFSTLIRIDALITTVIPWLLYFYFMEIYPRRIFKGKINIFVIHLIAGSLVSINLFIAERFSPVYFNDLLIFVELQIIIFVFINLLLYLSILPKFLCKKFPRIGYFKLLTISNLALIFLLILRGLNIFPFNLNFDKVYPYSILSLTWYLTPAVLVYLFYLLMKILSIKQVYASDAEISLLSISIIYLVVYGYDLGITIDEPWASRGLIRSIFPLTAILAITAFGIIVKNLKTKIQIKEFRNINTMFLIVILVGTLSVSHNFLFLKADNGQSEFIQKVCFEINKFSGSSSIVVIDSSLRTWAGPIRESCKTNLVVLMDESRFPSKSDIKVLENQMAETLDSKGFVFLSETHLESGKKFRLIYSDYNRPIGEAPRSIIDISQTIYVTFISYKK